MGLIYTAEEIQKKLHPVFKIAPVYKAILFGSYARGEAQENSDIDIVIDGRGELHGLQFYGVLDAVVEALGKPVDLIELSEIHPGAPILDAIAQQGVILYER
jgi:predicted nucleotidyltransferase